MPKPIPRLHNVRVGEHPADLDTAEDAPMVARLAGSHRPLADFDHTG
ncbi:MAG: hypothetical protein ACR2OU_08750 [Thermomicrobiales bacterium]